MIAKADDPRFRAVVRRRVALRIPARLGDGAGVRAREGDDLGIARFAVRLRSTLPGWPLAAARAAIVFRIARRPSLATLASARLGCAMFAASRTPAIMRFGVERRGGDAGDREGRDRPPDQPFDRGHGLAVLRGREHERAALPAGPPTTAPAIVRPKPASALTWPARSAMPAPSSLFCAIVANRSYAVSVSGACGR